MDTKNFFTKIREIIREEIEYALDKKINQKQIKKEKNLKKKKKK